MSKIVYRLADYTDAQDLQGICAMYRDVFGVEMADFLRFWYGENPAGMPLGVVAVEMTAPGAGIGGSVDGRIVGHFGTMATRALVRRQEVQGRISMGFMVDPSCRGQGVAVGLYRELFDRLEKAGGDSFVIGIPNDVSYQMHRERMGYELIRHYRFATLPAVASQGRYALVKENWKDIHPASLKRGVASKPILWDDKAIFDADINQMRHSSEDIRWRYANEKYLKFRSHGGNLFVATKFRNKVDILYWSPHASEAEVRDFAGFLYEEEKAAQVCTWNTKDWLDTCPQEERAYHFCIHPLTKDPCLRKALLGQWLFYMGDCELY